MDLDEAMSTPAPGGIRIDYTADELIGEDYEEIPALFSEERFGKRQPMIPLAAVGIIAGVGGCNKSTFLRQMAMCVSAGRSFNGWKYEGKHKSVLYVSTEDPKAVTKNFIKRMNESLSFPPEELRGLRFIFTSDDVIPKLEERLYQAPADLVIVDAFADVLCGKEQNSATDTREAMGPFANLAFRHNCTVLLLHHTNKGTDKQPVSRDNIAGSQAMVNKPRFAIEFRVDPVDKSLRHLCFVKHNYLPISYYQESSDVLRLEDNFVLVPTGRRVPFEELGGNTLLREDGKYDKVLVDVLKVMRANPTPISYGELKKAIMDYRDKGDSTAEKNIKHATKQGAIIKNESGNYIISHDYE